MKFTYQLGYDVATEQWKNLIKDIISEIESVNDNKPNSYYVDIIKHYVDGKENDYGF